MNVPRRSAAIFVLATLVVLPIAAQRSTGDSVDLDAIYRIKDEGLQRSHVMDVRWVGWDRWVE